MANEKDKLETKVLQIFKELAGDRLDRFRGDRLAFPFCDVVAEALSEEIKPEFARDIAFHLGDWNWDAAFLVALHLFPERFTSEEIRQGIKYVLIHAPNHIAAAAKLAGNPIKDIFELGPLVDE